MRSVWYVYILTNHTNSVLHTGITNNLERRLYEHRHHLDRNSFVSTYKLYKIVWFQEFPRPDQAIAAEKKIKGWVKRKKIDLIRKRNPTFASLDSSLCSEMTSRIKLSADCPWNPAE